MNLTTKARYAVMAMADLAINFTGKPVTVSDISKRQGIALNYLEQIFMHLRKDGLIQSVRGPGGGYKFARDIGDIRISEIVLAVDESIIMTRCENRGAENCLNGKSGVKCLTHNLWQGLTDTIYDYLNSLSLADIIKNEEQHLEKKRA